MKVLSVATTLANKPTLVKCLSNVSQIMKPALGHVYNTTVQDTDACCSLAMVLVCLGPGTGCTMFLVCWSLQEWWGCSPCSVCWSWECPTHPWSTFALGVLWLVTNHPKNHWLGIIRGTEHFVIFSFHLQLSCIFWRWSYILNFLKQGLIDTIDITKIKDPIVPGDFTF